MDARRAEDNARVRVVPGIVKSECASATLLVVVVDECEKLTVDLEDILLVLLAGGDLDLFELPFVRTFHLFVVLCVLDELLGLVFGRLLC